jgi:cytochrome c peroxidase
VTNTDGTRSLELMSSSGGSVSTILRDEMSEVSWGGGMFAWSPDGRYVFVVRGPRDRSRDEAALGVWRVPVGGDSPVRLAMRAGVCAGTAIPAVALTLMACASAPLGVRAPAARQIPVGLDLYMPVPSDNPMTAEKIALGQQLFFDRRLSRDGTLSCSSCHDPAHAFADRRTVSVGIGGRRGRRNVPTLVNRGYGRAFSWDGRAPSLEAQVLEPIANPVELGMPIADLLQRLAADSTFRSAFQQAFGRGVKREDLARALAAFVRTIGSGDSGFDRAGRGSATEWPPGAQRGRAIFLGKGNCWLCHRGPTLTDEAFHNTGVAWRAESFTDLGRAAVTGRVDELGAFKTPTLREVARTGPYMHNGSLQTLEEVVAHYDAGGRPNPNLDPRLRPLGLTPAEKQDLVAFLHSLSGRVSAGRW